MKTHFLFLCLLISCIVSAQTAFTIDGFIKSKDDNLPLESASVYVLNEADSSLITYTISDSKGFFELKNKSNVTDLKLYISFIGFKTFTKSINLKNEELHLNSILLEESGLLEEVELSFEAPVLIKEDTLEFSASSFKTKDDATVEDLLKKLPGVKIGKDGKITVNGKEVKDIKVNGKSFFGDDPTIAIKNLTKEMIEKVQISDSKSTDQAFTGEAGDSESKSINLTIKEDKNKGVFGRVAAGGGTDEHYEFAGLVNAFDNERRVSVLIGGNDINSPGFSYGEISKMYGGGRSVWMTDNGSFSIDGMQFGGNNGITTSRNYGLSFADNISENLEFSLNYFGSESKQIGLTAANIQNILPTETFFTDLNINKSGENKNHNINANFEYKRDTTWFVSYRPSFNINNSEGIETTFEISSRNELDTTNLSNSSRNNSSKGTTFSNDLGITRKYGTKGAFVRLNYNNKFQWKEGERLNNSLVSIFGDNPSLNKIDQKSDIDNTIKNHTTTLTIRQPLKGKTWFLDYGIGYDLSNEESENMTNDLDETTSEYSLYNLNISNDFDFEVKTLTPFSKLVYKTKKSWASLTATYRNSQQIYEDRLRPEQNINKTYNDFLLNLRGNYKFSPSKSIYTSVNNRVSAPRINQVQTNEDLSNPLNIVVGNPNLKPTTRTNIYGNYNNYDMQKGTGFYAWVYGSVVQNDIVTKRTIDENLITRTTYENVSGNYSFNGSVSKSLDISLDSLKTIELSGELGFGASKRKGFINNDQFKTNTRNLSPELEVVYAVDDKFDVGIFYNYDWTYSKYSTNAIDNLTINTHKLGLETYIRLSKSLTWENDINYSYTPGISSNFQQDFWLWNATLAYDFMDEKAKLTLKVYDLLNQNINTSRNAYGTITEDIEELTLQQYFMLTFSWKFNTMGSKGESGNRMDYFH